MPASASDPYVAEAFFAMIDHIQDRTNWEIGRGDFFGYWIGDTDNRDIIGHVNEEMANCGFEMWARSGRELAKAVADAIRTFLG